jgi:hypothetical protein
MRYMIMIKTDEANQRDHMPTDEELNEMGRFNDELLAAGVVLAMEGLHPAKTGRWISFDGDDRTISDGPFTDGPFTETKELIAGFWILQVASEDEALEWVRRIPMRSGAVEMRRVFEIEEFDQDNEFVQKEAKWREEQESRPV